MTTSSTMSETSPAVTPAALNVNDAARYTGLSASTIRRLESGGQLPAVRLNRRVLFRVRDLDAMLAAAVGVSK